jgi:hypothetical protein
MRPPTSIVSRTATMLAGLLLGAACGSSPYVCAQDGDCVQGGSNGRCEPNGFCSFPNDGCVSGFEYGQHAGDLAGECVDPAGGSGDGDDGSVTLTATAGDGDGDGGSDDTTDPGDSTATTAPEVPPVCGNGVVEIGEPCDGADLGVSDCETAGFDGGELGCTADCLLDTSACTTCGDGVADGDEVCDGDDLNEQTCARQGWFAGDLACARDCAAFDEAACTNCGNGRVDDGEACDGDTSFGSCLDLGFSGDGSIGCTDTCQADVSACGDIVCNGDPVPPGSARCPAECDTCEAGVCTILCDDTSECAAMSLACPAGWACAVECTGTSACLGTQIGCPDFYPCDVLCAGTTGCSSTTIACGVAGGCNVTCESDTLVCTGAELQCGLDSCTASCADDSAPNVVCGEACLCTPCG